MEVSSHALALHRVSGMRFDAAVFTNLGRDHLDLHESMEAYFRAKASLFMPDLSDVGVTNLDDPYGRLLLDVAAIDDGRLRAERRVRRQGRRRPTSRSRGAGGRSTVPIGGHFNVMNALAALTPRVGRSASTPTSPSPRSPTTPPVPGRFELVHRAAGTPSSLVVDYAHTPDGIVEVLTSARAVAARWPGDRRVRLRRRPRHRQAAADGCGRRRARRPGGRHVRQPAARGAAGDHRRRGRAASTRPGATASTSRSIGATAIRYAIAEAVAGDIVVVAGKGHETTQTIGDTVVAVRRPGGGAGAARRRRTHRPTWSPNVIAVMIAGAVSTIVSLFGTRYLIAFFRTRGRGQPILGKEDHGPEHHMVKQGTPTMGGIAIVVAAFIGWIVAHVRDIAFSDQAMIVWVGILAMSFMGLLDDWIKVRKRHNRGIFWKQKNYVTMLMSFGIAWWLVGTTGIAESISLMRADDLGFDVPPVVWVLWAGLIIWATTNAVNVTDGLDGLAGGSALMGFGAFMIIGYWAFRNPDVYSARGQPARHGRARRRLRRGVPRLPVVERGAGAHLHGRRRRARRSARRSPSWRSRSTPTCCCC